MIFFCKRPAAILLLALVAPLTAADESSNGVGTDAGKDARARISNAELSACVGGSIERYDDGVIPVGEVARSIWQACRGDESQAVADNPVAADMLHLRIRAMVTEHRNTVFAARAAKASVGKGSQAAKSE